MPTLPKKNQLTKVEEGKIIKMTKPMFDYFDYFEVTNNQLQRFAEAAQEATQFYNRMAKDLFGPTQIILKMQEQIASQVAELIKVFASSFEKISFIIPIPKIDVYIPKLTEVPIYIQPETKYVPVKELPSGKKKKKLPISAIEIIGNGFVAEGEYIKGLSLKSKPGRLLALMLRRDLMGVIPDNLIGEATGEEPDDYRAWGMVMRDLKEILMGKKLKMDVERQEALKRYQLNGLTRYIRRPKKLKSVKNKELIN